MPSSRADRLMESSIVARPSLVLLVLAFADGNAAALLGTESVPSEKVDSLASPIRSRGRSKNTSTNGGTRLKMKNDGCDIDSQF